MNQESKMALFLRTENRLCIVVGGGSVGRRKARVCLNAGARVRLVAREPRPTDQDDPQLDWLQQNYHSEVLIGAALVFAAATPEVNTQVVTDAGKRGIWVNSATDPDAGDFTLPAVGHLGSLTIAVGTSGAAPALARRVRDRLLANLDVRIAEWLELLEEIRPVVLDTIPDEATRHRLLDDFAEWRWLDQLHRDGRAATLAMMRKAIADCACGPRSDPLH